jgi:hypothetical protein
LTSTIALPKTSLPSFISLNGYLRMRRILHSRFVLFFFVRTF